ncbi:MFS transporter [Actinomadura sp. NBRC 104425]|uniref:MFS transporter n=1 Tax=Actinomadura sp. NBRC 104425 TaxID=3032204 RepID=UPI00249F9707|nr:MFS transporter [Actinomadura sp. NBRC 104425]GLZ15009.1 MFS transporter [Actinomadura sp. NBRC 104425]
MARQADGGVFSPQYRVLTSGVGLSVGLVAFESLGVATVLPEIARRLDGLDAYGWGLSASMLAQILGAVAAGQDADRRGPARPLALGLLVFAAGCALAGAAGSWPVFLLGRFAQGLGVGAVMGMAYAMIGLAYPERLRARMFALLSSAWTVPSLIGPTIAAAVADGVGWRGVFGLLPPLVAAAAVLTLPGVRALRPAAASPADETPMRAARPWWKGPAAASVLLTAGTGLFIQALLLDRLAPLVVLAVLGLGVAVAALGRVTPEGTLTARRGVGAGVALRFLLCGVYFGSEAFLPLGLTELRGVGAAEAGLGLSAGALTWVAGSALQAGRDGARRGDRTASMVLGSLVLLAGLVVMAFGVLVEAVPPLTAVAGWAIGGLGMGVAFNAATTETTERAPAARQGEVGAALQLAQTLATAVVSGIGGATIAIAHAHGGRTHTALVVTFALTGCLAVLAALLSFRLHPARAARAASLEAAAE